MNNKAIYKLTYGLFVLSCFSKGKHKEFRRHFITPHYTNVKNFSYLCRDITKTCNRDDNSDQKERMVQMGGASSPLDGVPSQPGRQAGIQHRTPSNT